MKTLRIGTRKSQLALWQAEYIRTRLQQFAPELSIELVKMATQGDKILDTSLAKVGGKGLFIKELEQGLLHRRIDIAVHSMKDVTVTLPEGLYIAAICEREDPRDALVSSNFTALTALPPGAQVGTSSLRRRCQLSAAFPHFHIAMLRGNVNTRLGKLDAGEFDAIILAAAGLKRLGLAQRIAAYIDFNTCLPAIGQGAIGIECRHDDPEINALVAQLDHAPTHHCVTAERAMNLSLEGGCQVPIGGYAELTNDQLRLRGLVGYPDGSHIIRSDITGAVEQAEQIGTLVATELLSKGAKLILDKVYGNA